MPSCKWCLLLWTWLSKGMNILGLKLCLWSRKKAQLSSFSISLPLKELFHPALCLSSGSSLPLWQKVQWAIKAQIEVGDLPNVISPNPHFVISSNLTHSQPLLNLLLIPSLQLTTISPSNPLLPWPWSNTAARPALFTPRDSWAVIKHPGLAWGPQQLAAVSQLVKVLPVVISPAPSLTVRPRCGNSAVG